MRFPLSGVLTRWSHHILHRMPFALAEPPVGKCLLVGASLERALLGCGGTLLRRFETGGQIGEGATNAKGLTVAALNATGDVRLELGYEIVQGDRVAAMAEMLNGGAVDIVMAPFWGSSEQDELAVVEELSTALRRAPHWGGAVWMYETLTPIWPNRGVDISGVVARKRELLAAELPEEQMHAVLGLNRYRGLRPVVQNAEAFLLLDARAFLRERARWRRGLG